MNLIRGKLEIMFTDERLENAYVFACALYIFTAMMFASLFSDHEAVHLYFPAARWICYLIILAKIFYDFILKKYTIRDILLIGAVGAFLLVIAFTTGLKRVLIYWVFIAAGHNVEYRKVIKWAAAAHFFGILIPVIACYIGILKNNLYVRSNGTVRESLGFFYTTEPANFFFYGVLLWIYARQEKITVFELIILLAADGFLYWKTDTKSACALTVLIISASLLLKYIRFLRTWRIGYQWIALMIAPLAACFIYFASVKYDPAVDWMSKLNRFITGRLPLGQRGIKDFGVTWLGQEVIFNGETPEGTNVYNYVDSSFLQILINFGRVFFALMLLGIVRFGKAISDHKDIYLLLVFCFFIVHSTFDPQLIWIEFNSFWLCYGYVASKEPQTRCVS